MNKEEQDKRWNNLSEESKNEILELYRYAKESVKESEYGNTIPTDLFEQRYGVHNLNPKLTPKTWEDVEKIYPDTYGNEDMVLFDFNEFAWDVNYIRKCKATLMISKLIDLGYGGCITEEEWKNEEIIKYGIDRLGKKIITVGRTDLYCFIAFHTPEQRDEFMSHESNRKLVELYYLI